MKVKPVPRKRGNAQCKRCRQAVSAALVNARGVCEYCRVPSPSVEGLVCEYELVPGECRSPAVGFWRVRLGAGPWKPFGYCSAHVVDLHDDLADAGFQLRAP